MHYLLRTPHASGKTRLWAMSRLMAPATIATLPRWMRELGGFDQPAVLDRAVVPLARAAMRAARSPRTKLAVLSGTLPETRRMLRQHLYGGTPEVAETITPAQARERYGKAAASA
jgi:hypothetical protein